MPDAPRASVSPVDPARRQYDVAIMSGPLGSTSTPDEPCYRPRPSVERDMASAIPSFLTARMKTSVKMNGVLVPFSKSLDNVQRFCRPVAAHNAGSDYDVSLYGSGFLFHVAGRNLMVCSRHQVVNSGRDPGDLMIILGEGDNAIGMTPSVVGHVSVVGSELEAVGDIFLAEFASGPGGRDISGSFFKVDDDADLRTVRPQDVTLIFTVGYPSRLVDYEPTYDEGYDLRDVAIYSRWAKVYLELDDRVRSDIPGLVPLQVHQSYRIELGDPDGFSGAPVFFIYQDAQRTSHLGFAGMVTHASKLGRFSMVEASYIHQAIRAML